MKKSFKPPKQSPEAEELQYLRNVAAVRGVKIADTATISEIREALDKDLAGLLRK